VAHTNQIEKKMDRKNIIGFNGDNAINNNISKRRGMAVRRTDFNVNEIAIFLKYQKGKELFYYLINLLKASKKMTNVYLFIFIKIKSSDTTF